MVQYMKRNFEFVRGTRQEIDEIPTKDMTVYLAWDTNEIFVGNSNGVKTPYNCEKKVINWVETEITKLKEDTYGNKGILYITPDMFVEISGTSGTIFEASIPIKGLSSYNWIDVRPVSREDMNILNDTEYSFFISTIDDNINITTLKKIDKSVCLEYFIMKGI